MVKGSRGSDNSKYILSKASSRQDSLLSLNTHNLNHSLSKKLKTINIEEELEKENKERLKIDVRWQEFIKFKQRNVKFDYEVLQEMGRGAFGSVSKVFLKDSQLLRAMKSIKKSSLIK